MAAPRNSNYAEKKVWGFFVKNADFQVKIRRISMRLLTNMNIVYVVENALRMPTIAPRKVAMAVRVKRPNLMERVERIFRSLIFT